MDTVEEGGVMELLRQRIEQVGMFEHVGHGVVGVADERHASLGP